MGDRRNLITPLRLGLALLVIVSHSWPLTQGSDAQEPLHRIAATISLGQVAVDGFFVLSGYLVTASWQRSPGLPYVRARLYRIYPGFLVATAFSVVAAMVWGHGVLSAAILPTVAVQAIFLQSVGVPATYGGPAAFAHLLNGSVGTILVEVLLYAVLAATLLVLRRRGWAGVLVIGTAFLLLALRAALANEGALVAEYGVAFCAGSLLQRFGGEWLSRPRWPLVGLALALWLAILALKPGALWTVDGLLLAYPLLSVGLLRIPPNVRNDYSYGTYLYAWPVQQVLVTALHLTSPLALMLLAIPAVIPFAVLSWHLVERPALQRVRPRPANATRTAIRVSADAAPQDALAR